MEPLSLGFVFSSAGVLHRSRREESGGAHRRDKDQNHTSVMVKEVIELLEPKKGELIVDATYGQGGHTKALKKSKATVVAIDADPAVRQSSPQAAGVEVANFADLETVFKKHHITKVDKVLFDLGWNRGQLVGRGFSFMHDEPLIMSYGEEPLSGFTARDVLNTWSEKAIADALFGYGEERYARRIARAVVERRALQPFETTIEFVEIIRDAVPAPYRHGRLHFATRSFQALRIAVNDELSALERGLKAAWKILAPCGRIAVITFHSIEDRLVKRLFVELQKKDGRVLTKKPQSASRAEIISNPSARSAKLRGIEKTCIQ